MNGTVSGDAMKRREFISGMGAVGAGMFTGCLSDRMKGVEGCRYPGWTPGELDIHFIQTGVGEQTFFILPDGTTMLLDCGDMYRPQYLPLIPRRPTDGRLGGEWVSRYVQRLIRERAIDYFLLSHWHADHCGKPSLRSEKTPDGRVVCGITRLAEDFSIRNYFDHQYPRAGVYGMNPDEDSLAMMREWIPFMGRRCGMRPHAFSVGAVNQISMLRGGRQRYADFRIVNLFSNCVYWDGSRKVDYAPRYFKNHPDADGKIPENSLSMGIRVEYGPFRAYFGGDIDLPDYENRLGPIVGPVDVCKANHHSCPSSMGAEFCRSVRAQAYMTSVWSPNQVTDRNLVNMSSRDLYPGERVILPGFLPDVKKSDYAGRKFMDDLLPAQGHSVFKVAQGGGAFDLFVLTDEDESMTVLHHRQFKSGANA